MAVRIEFKVLVYLTLFGNGVITETTFPPPPPPSSSSSESSSSSTEHAPQVTELLNESENITSPSPPKSLRESAKSASKQQSITASISAFNPSVYLGEIKEIELQSRRSTTLPFNNLQHVRFEGSIGVEGDTGTITYPQQNVYTNDPYDYNTDYRYEEYHNPPNGNQVPTYAEGYVTVQLPSKPVYYTSENPNHHVNVEIDAKPTKFEYEPHYHVQPYSSPPPALPPPTYYYPQVPQIHRPEVSNKPETLLYLSSHRETLMKTRKSPYKYYQPNDETVHYIEQGHAFPPRNLRVSPWKKLIHLIGAFLPFGLLLAALKPPSVVKIDRNTTQQPNIVLSKWRGIDLPLEHKEAENNNNNDCEDKSLCEIIVSGSEENADLISSILWNFAIKSTDDEAQRNGLGEIFNGVKKRDCSLINC